MKTGGVFLTSMMALLSLLLFLHSSATAQSLKERDDVLLDQIQRVHGLSNAQMDAVRSIFRESGYIGQGNPAITQHPMTPQG